MKARLTWHQWLQVFAFQLCLCLLGGWYVYAHLEGRPGFALEGRSVRWNMQKGNAEPNDLEYVIEVKAIRLAHVVCVRGLLVDACKAPAPTFAEITLYAHDPVEDLDSQQAIVIRAPIVWAK